MTDFDLSRVHLLAESTARTVRAELEARGPSGEHEDRHTLDKLDRIEELTAQGKVRDDRENAELRRLLIDEAVLQAVRAGDALRDVEEFREAYAALQALTAGATGRPVEAEAASRLAGESPARSAVSSRLEVTTPGEISRVTHHDPERSDALTRAASLFFRVHRDRLAERYTGQQVAVTHDGVVVADGDSKHFSQRVDSLYREGIVTHRILFTPPGRAGSPRPYYAVFWEETRDGVATIRPSSHRLPEFWKNPVKFWDNPLDSITQIFADLDSALTRALRNDHVHTVVLDCFSDWPPVLREVWTKALLQSGKSLDAVVSLVSLGAGLTRKIETFPKKVVSRIREATYGMPLEIALASDYLVMDEGAALSFPEVGEGSVPSLGTVGRMAYRMGRGLAFYTLLGSSGKITAQEARNLGLADFVVGGAFFEQDALAKIAEYPDPWKWRQMVELARGEADRVATGEEVRTRDGDRTRVASYVEAISARALSGVLTLPGGIPVRLTTEEIQTMTQLAACWIREAETSREQLDGIKQLILKNPRLLIDIVRSHVSVAEAVRKRFGSLDSGELELLEDLAVQVFPRLSHAAVDTAWDLTGPITDLAALDRIFLLLSTPHASSPDITLGRSFEHRPILPEGRESVTQALARSFRAAMEKAFRDGAMEPHPHTGDPRISLNGPVVDVLPPLAEELGRESNDPDRFDGFSAPIVAEAWLEAVGKLGGEGRIQGVSLVRLPARIEGRSVTFYLWREKPGGEFQFLSPVALYESLAAVVQCADVIGLKELGLLRIKEILGRMLSVNRPLGLDRDLNPVDVVVLTDLLHELANTLEDAGRYLQGKEERSGRENGALVSVDRAVASLRLWELFLGDASLAVPSRPDLREKFERDWGVIEGLRTTLDALGFLRVRLWEAESSSTNSQALNVLMRKVATATHLVEQALELALRGLVLPTLPAQVVASKLEEVRKEFFSPQGKGGGSVIDFASRDGPEMAAALEASLKKGILLVNGLAQIGDIYADTLPGAPDDPLRLMEPHPDLWKGFEKEGGWQASVDFFRRHKRALALVYGDRFLVISPRGVVGVYQTRKEAARTGISSLKGKLPETVRGILVDNPTLPDIPSPAHHHGQVPSVHRGPSPQAPVPGAAEGDDPLALRTPERIPWIREPHDLEAVEALQLAARFFGEVHRRELSQRYPDQVVVVSYDRVVVVAPAGRDAGRAAHEMRVRVHRDFGPVGFYTLDFGPEKPEGPHRPRIWPEPLFKVTIDKSSRVASIRLPGREGPSSPVPVVREIEDLMFELDRELTRLIEDETVQTIVLEDLDRWPGSSEGAWLKDIPATPEGHKNALELIAIGLRLLHFIEHSPKNIVARVDGPLSGLPLSVALAADYLVAGPSATFSFRDSEAGLIPPLGDLVRLDQRVGRGVGLYLALGGDFGKKGDPWLDARTAHTIGLVDILEESESAAAIADHISRTPQPWQWEEMLGLSRRFAKVSPLHRDDLLHAGGRWLVYHIIADGGSRLLEQYSTAALFPTTLPDETPIRITREDAVRMVNLATSRLGDHLTARLLFGQSTFPHLSGVDKLPQVWEGLRRGGEADSVSAKLGLSEKMIRELFSRQSPVFLGTLFALGDRSGTPTEFLRQWYLMVELLRARVPASDTTAPSPQQPPHERESDVAKAIKHLSLELGYKLRAEVKGSRLLVALPTDQAVDIRPEDKTFAKVASALFDFINDHENRTVFDGIGHLELICDREGRSPLFSHHFYRNPPGGRFESFGPYELAGAIEDLIYDRGQLGLRGTGVFKLNQMAGQIRLLGGRPLDFGPLGKAFNLSAGDILLLLDNMKWLEGHLTSTAVNAAYYRDNRPLKDRVATVLDGLKQMEGFFALPDVVTSLVERRDLAATKKGDEARAVLEPALSALGYLRVWLWNGNEKSSGELIELGQLQSGRLDEAMGRLEEALLLTRHGLFSDWVVTRQTWRHFYELLLTINRAVGSSNLEEVYKKAIGGALDKASSFLADKAVRARPDRPDPVIRGWGRPPHSCVRLLQPRRGAPDEGSIGKSLAPPLPAPVEAQELLEAIRAARAEKGGDGGRPDREAQAAARRLAARFDRHIPPDHYQEHMEGGHRSFLILEKDPSGEGLAASVKKRFDLPSNPLALLFARKTGSVFALYVGENGDDVKILDWQAHWLSKDDGRALKALAARAHYLPVEGTNLPLFTDKDGNQVLIVQDGEQFKAVHLAEERVVPLQVIAGGSDGRTAAQPAVKLLTLAEGAITFGASRSEARLEWGVGVKRGDNVDVHVINFDDADDEAWAEVDPGELITGEATETFGEKGGIDLTLLPRGTPALFSLYHRPEGRPFNEPDAYTVVVDQTGELHLHSHGPTEKITEFTLEGDLKLKLLQTYSRAQEVLIFTLPRQGRFSETPPTLSVDGKKLSFVSMPSSDSEAHWFASCEAPKNGRFSVTLSYSGVTKEYPIDPIVTFNGDFPPALNSAVADALDIQKRIPAPLAGVTHRRGKTLIRDVGVLRTTRLEGGGVGLHYLAFRPARLSLVRDDGTLLSGKTETRDERTVEGYSEEVKAVVGVSRFDSGLPAIVVIEQSSHEGDKPLLTSQTLVAVRRDGSQTIVGRGRARDHNMLAHDNRDTLVEITRTPGETGETEDKLSLKIYNLKGPSLPHFSVGLNGKSVRFSEGKSANLPVVMVSTVTVRQDAGAHVEIVIDDRCYSLDMPPLFRLEKNLPADVLGALSVPNTQKALWLLGIPAGLLEQKVGGTSPKPGSGRPVVRPHSHLRTEEHEVSMELYNRLGEVDTPPVRIFERESSGGFISTMDLYPSYTSRQGLAAAVKKELKPSEKPVALFFSGVTSEILVLYVGKEDWKDRAAKLPWKAHWLDTDAGRELARLAERLNYVPVANQTLPLFTDNAGKQVLIVETKAGALQAVYLAEEKVVPLEFGGAGGAGETITTNCYTLELVGDNKLKVHPPRPDVSFPPIEIELQSAGAAEIVYRLLYLHDSQGHLETRRPPEIAALIALAHDIIDVKNNATTDPQVMEPLQEALEAVNASRAALEALSEVPTAQEVSTDDYALELVEGSGTLRLKPPAGVEGRPLEVTLESPDQARLVFEEIRRFVQKPRVPKLVSVAKPEGMLGLLDAFVTDVRALNKETLARLEKVDKALRRGVPEKRELLRSTVDQLHALGKGLNALSTSLTDLVRRATSEASRGRKYKLEERELGALGGWRARDGIMVNLLEGMLAANSEGRSGGAAARVVASKELVVGVSGTGEQGITVILYVDDKGETQLCRIIRALPLLRIQQLLAMPEGVLDLVARNARADPGVGVRPSPATAGAKGPTNGSAVGGVILPFRAPAKPETAASRPTAGEGERRAGEAEPTGAAALNRVPVVSVRAKVHDGVAHVAIAETTDRPVPLSQVLKELHDLVTWSEGLDDVQMIVLTGLDSPLLRLDGPEIARQIGTARGLAEFLSQHAKTIALLKQIGASHKNVVAVLEGNVFGPGLEVALYADKIIVVEGARLSLPYARDGLVPMLGGARRLAARVGNAKALQHLIAADTSENVIGAEEAVGMGLADHLVSKDQLNAKIAGLKARSAAHADAGDTVTEPLEEVGLPVTREDVRRLKAEVGERPLSALLVTQDLMNARLFTAEVALLGDWLRTPLALEALWGKTIQGQPAGDEDPKDALNELLLPLIDEGVGLKFKFRGAAMWLSHSHPPVISYEEAKRYADNLLKLDELSDHPGLAQLGRIVFRATVSTGDGGQSTLFFHLVRPTPSEPFVLLDMRDAAETIRALLKNESTQDTLTEEEAKKIRRLATLVDEFDWPVAAGGSSAQELAGLLEKLPSLIEKMAQRGSSAEGFVGIIVSAYNTVHNLLFLMNIEALAVAERADTPDNGVLPIAGGAGDSFGTSFYILELGEDEKKLLVHPPPADTSFDPVDIPLPGEGAARVVFDSLKELASKGVGGSLSSDRPSAGKRSEALLVLAMDLQKVHMELRGWKTWMRLKPLLAVSDALEWLWEEVLKSADRFKDKSWGQLLSDLREYRELCESRKASWLSAYPALLGKARELGFAIVNVRPDFIVLRDRSGQILVLEEKEELTSAMQRRKTRRAWLVFKEGQEPPYALKVQLDPFAREAGIEKGIGFTDFKQGPVQQAARGRRGGSGKPENPHFMTEGLVEESLLDVMGAGAVSPLVDLSVEPAPRPRGAGMVSGEPKGPVPGTVVSGTPFQVVRLSGGETGGTNLQDQVVAIAVKWGLNEAAVVAKRLSDKAFAALARRDVVEAVLARRGYQAAAAAFKSHGKTDRVGLMMLALAALAESDDEVALAMRKISGQSTAASPRNALPPGFSLPGVGLRGAPLPVLMK